ncbi:MAG: hypothetical protein GXY07_04585 [Candidatus Hydrogenedentes bacterium]|nr:hypothetical protein [Candidatus Hydrogenedentota bacterium]
MKLNSRRDILLMAAVILGAMFPAVAVQRQHPAVRDAEANRHNFNQALATLAKLRDGQEAAETIEEQPLIIVEADPAEKAVPAEDGASSAATESPKGDDVPPAEPVEGESAPVTTYRRVPLNTGGIRAPRPSRPSANPLEQLDKRTLQDALLRPLEFGETSLGFEPPDWTEPLRDIEADSMVTDLNTNETVLNDNVHLRLGAMLFESDAFRYSEAEGHYQAVGNVRVRQHESTLTADKLTYTAPDPEIVERTFILEPGPDEQRFAKRRLSMGRLLAENLHVVEPTREMRAEYVDYDFAKESGEIRNAQGVATIFHYDAAQIQINGPDDAVIKDAWLTTCPRPNPHYRIHVDELTLKGKEDITVRKARLYLGRVKTPFYIPFYRGGENRPYMLDYESGRRAEIGYFANVGTQFEISPEVTAGPRIMPTEKEGVGLGGDLYYDFMRKPSSYLYRTKGEAHVLHTTEDRGYGMLRHRWEYDDNLVLRMEAEHWSDEDFYKDFFYDDYRNRTTPRTFANITYRHPDFIASGTARVNTHSWISETESLPEAAFHLIERPLAHNFFVSYDTISGYNRQKWMDMEGARSIHIARLTYDWEPVKSLNITPFYEAEGAWYQRTADWDDSATRFSNTFGVTAQTRLHKVYPGFLGFSGFKHVIEPSITYSYRPSSTLAAEKAPRFDSLDNVYGRSRIETKINNVFYGKDAETNEVWQAARLTLYQGNDFWNEVRKADDYEFEIDVRPRPWWGVQVVGEKHNIDEDFYLGDTPPLYKRWFYDAYEELFNDYYNEEAENYRSATADFARLLTQVYYDNTLLGGKITSRLGFAYTDTRGEIFNREILYGMGYRLNEKWAVGFEHIYNLKGGYMRSQTYELRHKFDCWETALRFRDRESGFDVNVEFSLVAFPGSAIRF